MTSFRIVTALSNFHKRTCLICLLTLLWTHMKVGFLEKQDRGSPDHRSTITESPVRNFMWIKYLHKKSRSVAVRSSIAVLIVGRRKLTLPKSGMAFSVFSIFYYFRFSIREILKILEQSIMPIKFIWFILNWSLILDSWSCFSWKPMEVFVLTNAVRG